jgi:hypothetical protein
LTEEEITSTIMFFLDVSALFRKNIRPKEINKK